MNVHDTPWRVEYAGRHRTIEATGGAWDWDQRSSPYVVDALGKRVIGIPQNVHHPGAYDAKADRLAQLIVRSVNAEALLATIKKELAADDAVAASGQTALNYSPQEISHRLHFLLESLEKACRTCATCGRLQAQACDIQDAAFLWFVKQDDRDDFGCKAWARREP